MLFLLSSLLAHASETLWPDLSTSPRVGGGGRDAAIVVAIEDYNVVSDIPGARDNGRDWYTWLINGRGIPAGRVKLLMDSQATREEILAATQQMASQVQSGGTLWFVFVGHGAPSETGQDGILVGWDTQQTARSLYARGLPQSEVIGALEKGGQAQTMLVLDACFSGRDSGEGEPLVAGLQPLVPTYAVQTRNTTVLSAGQSNEFAGPLPGLGRPAFSYLLLGALRGWGDADGDRSVTAQEAVDYTSGALNAVLIGRSQTPQLAGPAAAAPLATTAAERGPDLAAVRLALAGTSGGTVGVTGGSGALASQLAQLEALQRQEASLKAERDRIQREIETQVKSQSEAVQGEARQMWSRVSQLADAGGETGKKALEAFIQEYGAKVVVVGQQQYPVSIPEVESARSRLAAYSAAAVQPQRADPVPAPQPAGRGDASGLVGYRWVGTIEPTGPCPDGNFGGDDLVVCAVFQQDGSGNLVADVDWDRSSLKPACDYFDFQGSMSGSTVTLTRLADDDAFRLNVLGKALQGTFQASPSCDAWPVAFRREGSAPVAAAPVAPAPVSAPESGVSLSKQLLKIGQVGGSGEWDAAVKPLMLGAYDTNRSGMIDTASEVSAVPCSTWRVLDQQIRDGRGEPASLYVTYISPPWLTNLIGVDQRVEGAMMEAVQRCELYYPPGNR